MRDHLTYPLLHYLCTLTPFSTQHNNALGPKKLKSKNKIKIIYRHLQQDLIIIFHNLSYKYYFILLMHGIGQHRHDIHQSIPRNESVIPYSLGGLSIALSKETKCVLSTWMQEGFLLVCTPELILWDTTKWSLQSIILILHLLIPVIREAIGSLTHLRSILPFLLLY